MANYFTQFSVTVPLTEKFKIFSDELRGEIENLVLLEDGEYPNFQYEVTPTEVWIYAEESGELEEAADFIQDILDAGFSTKEEILLEWANTCSKMKINSFSGGAVLIRKGKKQEWCSPSDELQKRVKEVSDATS